MKQVDQLRELLRRIDRKGFKAYRDIQGEYRVGDLTLVIDHVQADPFASPSRIRLIYQRCTLNLPEIGSRNDRTSLEDFLARRFNKQIRLLRPGGGSGKSSAVQIDSGRQEVLERTACSITDDRVELRVSVGLPAQGRTILDRSASTLLTDDLPELASAACKLSHSEFEEPCSFIRTIADSTALRDQLHERGFVAFVSDGSVLPRESGISDQPMRGNVVPFRSPESLRVELEFGNGDRVVGMGIPEGVTVIVGGGFHGKSTLLEALSRSVYNHIPGDGREFVVTRDDAVKIRAEDGRSVVGCDLRAFIRRLPLGRETSQFSSENASGSTSQAANILESLEAGSRLLLMDEDTCATNFMIRDDIMRRLVRDEHEPITPLIDRVRQMYDDLGVSSILVMGGAGDYFGVADTVIWMSEYIPYEVTDRATKLVERRNGTADAFPKVVERVPQPESVGPTRRNRTKARARGTEEIGFGREKINLRQVARIVDPSQTRGIAEILVYARSKGLIDGKASVAEILDAIDDLLASSRIDSVSSFRGHPGDLARPRRYEIGAVLNRLRTLRVSQRQ
jgi:predicted ABC-class ATPase